MNVSHGLKRLTLAFAILAVASCAHRAPRLPSGKVSVRQEGIASWYGPKFHGRKTSSGERYDMHGLTAAHRTLPLGTVVRVTHLGNGKRVVVRINDRGPFVEGRIIDLSYGAARRLGMVKEGVARVLVEAFSGKPGIPLPTESSSFSVQVGSFLVPGNAEKLKRDLGSAYGPVTVTPFEDNDATYYRVRITGFVSEAEALRTGRRLESAGLKYFVIADR